ncbi:MAG: translocation/assembly module TamB domain-containing protein [Flavitalea sp.]
MVDSKPADKKGSSLAGKIIKIFFRIVLVIILLISLVALLILTPPVQNIIRKKAVSFLSNKLDTRVEVGRIYIGFPKKIVIEDLYLEDRKKDTLVSGGKIEADISMLKLLNGEIELNKVELSAITAKIKRVLPDTAYNFQFIIDAFASKSPQPVSTDTSSMKISVKDVFLDKIRLVYNDAVTGNDMTLWLEHFDTRFKTFDLADSNFELTTATLIGLEANILRRKPLLTAASTPAENTQTPSAFGFNFDKLLLENIKLRYEDQVADLYTQLSLEKLNVDGDLVNLAQQSVSLKSIALQKAQVAFRMGKKETAAVRGTDSAESVNGWKIYVKNITLDDNAILFDDNSKSRLKQGMDYAHVSATGIVLHAHDFLFTPDSIAGVIDKGEMIEKSGLQLTALQTDFLYAANETYLKNLLIETPGTRLQSTVSLHYPSIAALQKNIGDLKVNADLKKSRIQVKDILLFAPFLSKQPAFSNSSEVWTMDGKISGAVSGLNLKGVDISALNDTRISVSGNIAGLPNAKKVNGNLIIHSIHTSKKDIRLMVPAGSLPENITLPDNIELRGSVSGSMENVRAKLELVTNLGSAALDGTIANAANKNKAAYRATISARALQLGKILQNDSLYGSLTAQLTASGKGYDQKTAATNFKGNVISAVLNRYAYRDIDFSGSLADQKAAVKINSSDPNLRFALDANSDISAKFPSVKMNAVIDGINTLPLHFTSHTLMYSGSVSADFPVTDPENLKGEALIANSVLTANGQRYKLDSIKLNAGESDSGNFVRLKSEAFNLELSGKYHLAQLGTVLQRSIQPYYNLSAPDSGAQAKIKTDSLKAYDFSFRAQIVNSPLFKAFIPDLETLDPVNLQGHFASGKGFQATASAPLVIMGANRLEHFTLNAKAGTDGIRLQTGMEEFSNGASFTVYNSTINAIIANNAINFLANIKDKASKNKYRMGGTIAQPEPGDYAISFHPDSLMLNYDKWTIAPDNILKLHKGDIHVSDFILGKGAQQISVKSRTTEVNAPIDLEFNNFRIGTITAFANQDSLLADGTINGKVSLNDLTGQPNFNSDLTITDLMIKTDTVGNIELKVGNTTKNVFTAHAAITGKGNDVELKGNYYLKPDNQSIFDLAVDIRKLQMSSIQALSAGAITQAKGFMGGKFDVKGTFEKPDVNGHLDFNQTGFSPSALGSYFTIDKESIVINQEGIKFDQFSIRDSSGNELNLDGAAYTSNFMNYTFNLDLTADNFQALNSVKKRGSLFYGQFYFDTDLHIKGTEVKPVVDGNLTVNERTKLTIVLPQDEPGVADREGIIRFIDADSLRLDSNLLVIAKDTLSRSGIKGMDVSVNIEVNKNAELTLIVDESNGDFLRMKGTAQLNGGIDPSGKTTLTGSYEIDEGAYELSFNLLKRKFLISKGSKIVWLGEPTRANVNLTAVYVANTAPLSLVENQSNISNINIYKQRLPFEVNLKLNGELLKPEVTFDVILPADKNYNVDASVIDNVNTRLTQLRTEPSELNKQVFALLLLNRFVSENPFASTGSGGIGSIARQSVSKLLTEQLNTLASDLVKGVDLNFDVASSDDYTTGNQQNRTDLNVSLSKQLLNDRLKVTVGSNFELEGPQNNNQKSNNLAGNVALDYLLSKDGRYLLRAYRKNEYEGELDGYIIETGVNFIIILDYDHFRELFHLPKNPKRILKKNIEPDESDTRKAGPVINPGIKEK